MRLIAFKKTDERGDTIVEVLIAIAIISLILGGAFILTNRSLKGTQSAQERLNAIKLVESQLEQVKNLAATDGDAVFGSSVPPSFCVNNSGGVVSSSNAGCKVGINGNPATAEPIFNLSITRSGNTFTVRNVWNNVRGSQDNIEMKYRVYE